MTASPDTFSSDKLVCIKPRYMHNEFTHIVPYLFYASRMERYHNSGWKIQADKKWGSWSKQKKEEMHIMAPRAYMVISEFVNHVQKLISEGSGECSRNERWEELGRGISPGLWFSTLQWDNRAQSLVHLLFC